MNAEHVAEALGALLADPVYSDNAKKLAEKYKLKTIDSMLDTVIAHFKSYSATK
jgi:hypothetical protein